MRCRHCYQDDFSSQSELSLDSLKRLADTVFTGLKDARISVNMTGGEPLLIPWFFDLVEYLHSFENLEEVNIITNGTIASPQIYGEIRRLPKIGALKISIESGSEAVNDSIRGAGAFKRILDGIAAFQMHTDKPVVLMVTLGKHNADTIRQTVRFAKDHGASGIIFERFIPLGQGRNMAQEVLGQREWLDAVREITNAARIDIEPYELLPYKAFWLHLNSYEDRLKGAMCNLGTQSMALMPDGDVFPCRRLLIPVGNLFKEPLDAVMKKLNSFEVLNLARKLHGRFCGLCGVDGCIGCRALALAAGDQFGDDPQCYLRLLEE